MNRDWVLPLALGVLIVLSGPILLESVIYGIQSVLVWTRIDPNPLCNLDCSVWTFGLIEAAGLVLIIGSLVWWLRAKMSKGVR